MRVLIIDDNPLFCKSVKTLLENQFHVVGETGCLKTASTLIKQEKPKALILDLVIPGQDVLQFMKQTKQEYPHIGIIVCSSLKEEHIVSRVLEAGCFDYIFKPLKEQKLFLSLEKIGALERIGA